MQCCAVPCRAVPCRAVPCRAVPCRAVPCICHSPPTLLVANDWRANSGQRNTRRHQNTYTTHRWVRIYWGFGSWRLLYLLLLGVRRHLNVSIGSVSEVTSRMVHVQCHTTLSSRTAMKWKILTTPVCVCVCVCACVRACVRACVCVCVRVRDQYS